MAVTSCARNGNASSGDDKPLNEQEPWSKIFKLDLQRPIIRVTSESYVDRRLRSPSVPTKRHSVSTSVALQIPRSIPHARSSPTRAQSLGPNSRTDAGKHARATFFRSAGSSTSTSSSSTSSSSSDHSTGCGRSKKVRARRKAAAGQRGRHLWDPPSDAAPACQGLPESPCTLALDGSGAPGAASASDAGCVFCSAARLENLMKIRRGSVVTSYLRRLPEAHRKRALSHIQHHCGKKRRRDYQRRLARRAKRTDPARPRRGPRGHYKRRSLDKAWGLAGKTDTAAGRRRQEAEGHTAGRRAKTRMQNKKDRKRKHKHK